MARALAALSLLLACPALSGGPKPPPGPPPSVVLLLAESGRASPVACLGAGRVVPGIECRGPLRDGQPLQTSAGDAVTTHGWDATGGLCPWDSGSKDDAKLRLGSFSLCGEEEDCPEEPAKLLLWPSRSKVKLSEPKPMPADAPESAKQLAQLAAVAKLDPATLVFAAAFELDLDGDGKKDRVVQLRQPRKEPHPRDISIPTFTFIVLAGHSPRLLAEAGCTGEGEFLGAVDLDGDGALELVMRFQYQVILFRPNGSVLLENAACCGLG